MKSNWIRIVRLYPLWSYPVIFLLMLYRGYKKVHREGFNRRTIEIAWRYAVGMTRARVVKGEYRDDKDRIFSFTKIREEDITFTHRFPDCHMDFSIFEECDQ